MPVSIARISAQPLSVDEHHGAVTAPGMGAVTTFVGQVRDHDPSVKGEVTHLEYSAHPDAEQTLARIAHEIAQVEVTLAVTHRVGLLAVGDAAIVVAAAAAHRAQAFDACRELVERVKAELPIWKREVLVDGSHTWVGVS